MLSPKVGVHEAVKVVNALLYNTDEIAYDAEPAPGDAYGIGAFTTILTCSLVPLTLLVGVQTASLPL